MIDRVETARLVLRPAMIAALRASVESPAALALATGCNVPEDWPPKEWDTPAVEWLTTKLSSASPDDAPWFAWFVIERATNTLIGTFGFVGPPVDGIIEIGYGIVNSRQRQGFASEAAAVMIARAFGDPRIGTVIAHTRHGDPASAGVLRKNGFTLGSTKPDETLGAIDRYELK